MYVERRVNAYLVMGPRYLKHDTRNRLNVIDLRWFPDRTPL